MNELIESRFIVQSGTLLNAVVFFVLAIVLIRMKIFDWRFLVFPLLILPQRIIFYAYVVFMQPEPSGILTFWSAVITYEEIAAGLIIVLVLAYPKLKERCVEKCASIYRKLKK